MIDSNIAQVKVGGAAVRYRIRHGRATDSGAPPLLCIHGLGCSSDVWAPLVRCATGFGCPFTIIAPDMPGCGPLCGNAKAHGIAELADWLAAFLDAVGLERVHAAGHSMGCQVALALARRHPDRIERLILAGPTLGCRHCSAARYAAGLVVDALHETVGYTTVLLRMCAQMGPRRYLATVGEMMRDDPFEGIDRIAAPTLVLRGRYDPIVPDRLARRFAETLQQGQYQVTPGVAHALPYTKPAQFMRIATEFLGTEECPTV